MENEYWLKRNYYIGNDKHLGIIKRHPHSFPLHAHDYFEMEIVLSGRGIYRVNGQTYFIQKNSAYVVGPSMFHEMEILEDIVQWNISFDESMLTISQIEAILSGRFCRTLSENEIRKLDLACDLLHQEFLINGDMQPLFSYVLNIVLPKADMSRSFSPMRQAMLFIETHFRESPTLAQAAERAHLSPVYFGALFKKINGETYISFLNSRKVICAQNLLENGFSVTEACFASGFGSLSSFLQTFKQKTGYSPKVYRTLKLGTSAFSDEPFFESDSDAPEEKTGPTSF